MKFLRLAMFLLCCNVGFISAQTIKVQPYLQDAEPNSIFILWETDSYAESIVQWGPTEALGNTAQGTSNVSQGISRIHEVQIENLERFTKYYYRAISGTDTTAIFSFKTPPFSSDNESFRIIAMSDMQRDGSVPNKFEEVINDGVIDYLEEEVGGDLVDNLALVMIPGDLVPNGLSYGQWENTFFDPAENLFNHIPVYPVLGNHENNATYFFQYFKMPENGTEGFEEHWWHKDYGNVRIIGLDSNTPFNNPEQLEWLDEVLDATCASDSIDFVFAQLHHPHKSELWTPGESDYTGDVIERLEQFSTDCGKPSVHLFGHTHGYSRGQSLDHKHLWINAATAGGAIDLWGEWPQFDYDEFSVSQDEYGFVSVEVTAGDDPKIVVKRITRGDANNVIDNDITDSVTVKQLPSVVNVPNTVNPLDIEIAPECVVLKANGFSSPNEDAVHGQSHWQVSLNSNDFSEPVAESWKNFENWYFEEDTQAGDDLTDESIEGLEAFTNYYWRVRYRDRELNWSEWSSIASFSTGASLLSPNLVLNPGAEDGLDEWTIVEGVVEAVTDGECNGISPFSGEKYFAVGGLCDHSPVGRCIQDIDVTAYSEDIDTGEFTVNYGGALADYGGSDVPELRLIFLDTNAQELGSSEVLENANPSWLVMNSSMAIPAQTRTVRVEMKGTRFAGTDNDSYFDEVFVRLGSNTPDCACGGAPDCVELTGTADWISDCGVREMTIAFYEAGTNTLVELFTSSIEEDGSYALSNIPIGNYDIFVKLEGNLQRGYFNQTISAGTNNLNLGTFIQGDLNGDDGVNIIDFSLINAAFGSTEGEANYNPLADLNCDGGVNIIDVSVLNASFGMTGDMPIAP